MHAYSEALREKDAQALRAMLTEQSRTELSAADVKRLLGDNQAELGKKAAALEGCTKSESCRPETRAQLTFADGSETELVSEGGSFRLVAAGNVPAAPATPEAALVEFRLALERRSLPLLLGLLEQGKRKELEGSFDLLVEALRGLDQGWVETRGDRARVELPGGVHVSLRRVRGSWWIEDIE